MSIVFTVDVSSNLFITLPVSGSVNVIINWGDESSPEAFSDPAIPSHTYQIPGTYTIDLSGSFTNLHTNEDFTYNNGLIDFAYNIQIPELTSFESAFSGVITPFTISLADDIVTNNVTIMNAMFDTASNFNSPLTNLNTSAVTTMNAMFANTNLFNQDLSLNTSLVTDMTYMFKNSPLFNGAINFSDTSKVTNMGYMFDGDASFNQPLIFDTSSVEVMSYMFQGASAFNQDLSFNTSSVTNMASMFNGASAFNQDISGWIISSLTEASNMFDGSALSTDNYNNLLIGWGSQPTIISGVPFGAASISYNNLPAKSAHDILTNTYSWNITDGGYTPVNIVFTVDVSANATISLPVSGNVNVTIDWNDGSSPEPFTSNNPNHTYLSDGIYYISLTGTFTDLKNEENSSDYNNSLIDFSYNTQIPELIVFTFAFTSVTTAFTISLVDNTVTSNVTEMSGMFFNASNFNSPLTNLNTSSVYAMDYMFYGASKFNQELSFNTSSVYAMDYMFDGASLFNQDISGWIISSLNEASSMFDNSALSTDNYNNLLIGWGNQPTIQSNVNFGAAGVNYNSVSAKSAHDYLTSTKSWNIIDGGYTGYVPPPVNIIFTVDVSTNAMISLPVSGSVNVTIDWNDGSSTEPFTSNNPSHTYSNDGIYNISLTGTFTDLFNEENSSDYNNSLIDLSYNVNIPELTSFAYAFWGVTTAFTISLVDNTVTSNVTNMNSMFYGASAYNSPLTNLNTISVTNMSNMFYGASTYNQDVSFNTISVTNMSNMFSGASSFNKALSFNTISVTNMSNMFDGASAFNQDVSFNTISVTNMSNMFSGASSFNKALSFNTISVTNMSNMFSGASIFNQDLSAWNISSLTIASNMLDGSALSSNNYNKLLVGWANQPTILSNVIFGAANIAFTKESAKVAHDILTNTYSWNITDGGYTGPSSDIIITINLPSSGLSVVLPVSGNVNVTINWGDGTVLPYKTNNPTHTYTNAGSFSINIIGTFTNLNNSNDVAPKNYSKYLTNFAYNDPIPELTSFAYAFSNVTSSFTLSITDNTITNNVTNMNNMFSGATSFNQPLSFVTSSVTNMSNMFYGARLFNQDLSAWNISSLTNASNMLDGSGLSSNNYNSLLVGWGNQPTIQSNVPFGAANIIYRTSFAKAAHDILTDTYNWVISDGGYTAPYPCFKEGSKILTDKGYKTIETLRSGDLVKTLKNGFKPIYKIGKRELQHAALKHRIKEQLYRFSKEKFPDVFEDLVLTGCHSILIDNFENEQQKEKAIEINSGRLCVTDGKFRLPACLENKASIYEQPGTYTIYHIALENDDYIMNYGVYANGLLVETCSKRYLNELSGMTII